jgi:tRNA uridine 5-carbamoylmethylation protein Kti12
MRLQYYLTEGIEDKGIFKAVIMAGVPGGGKSYVLKKTRSGSIEPRMVNTDKTFPLFKQYWNEDWGKIHTKVKTISKNQLALYINSLLPLAVDGTANKTSVVLRRAGLLEGFGYDTAMVFINTSLETALRRAGKRERQVDTDFIKTVYDQVNKAKTFYRSRFQTWMEVDNDEGELNDKAILHAFKFMNAFYNSPLSNPVGNEAIDEMRTNGWKYLSPNVRDMKEIQNILGAWYKG